MVKVAGKPRGPAKKVKRPSSKKTIVSKVMETGVIDEKKPVSEKKEIATIISKAFDLAAKDHIKFELLTTIIGLIVIGIAVIPIASGSFVGGAVLAIIGVIILVFGMFIHKPHKITMLSKVYTVSYVVPYKPALLFDGTDIIPDQVITYNDIPLDDIRALSKKLPNPPTSYKNEMALVNVLNKKKELVGKKKSYEFVTPAVLNNDIYVSAVLNGIPYCTMGNPTNNPLVTKVSIQEAIKHKEEIENLEEAERVIKLMNDDKKIISVRAKPFVDNLSRGLGEINDHFSKVSALMKKRLFDGFNIFDDRTQDADYGYEYVDSKYHIKVQSPDSSLNPIAIFQRVINEFDRDIKQDITISRNRGKSEKKKIEKRARSEAEKTNKDFEFQYSQLQGQIQTAQHEANVAYNKAQEAYSDAKRNAHDPAVYNQYIERYERYDHECNTKQGEVQRLTAERDRAEQTRNDQIRRITEDQRMLLEDTEREMEEEIQTYRNHVDGIIRIRNEQIEMFETIDKTLIPSEKKVQCEPFNNRKNKITGIQESIKSNFDKRIKERDEILRQIESFKVRSNIKVPTKVSIPFWILTIDKKTEVETIVFPPLKMFKHSETKKPGRNFTDFTSPLSTGLEESTKYLKTDRFLNEAKSASIIGKVAPQIASEVDLLATRNLITPGYAKRIKKYYGIMPRGG